MSEKQLHIVLFIGFSALIIITFVYFVGYHRFNSDFIGSIYQATIMILGMGIGVLLKTTKRKTQSDGSIS